LTSCLSEVEAVVALALVDAAVAVSAVGGDHLSCAVMLLRNWMKGSNGVNGGSGFPNDILLWSLLVDMGSIYARMGLVQLQWKTTLFSLA